MRRRDLLKAAPAVPFAVLGGHAFGEQSAICADMSPAVDTYDGDVPAAIRRAANREHAELVKFRRRLHRIRAEQRDAAGPDGITIPFGTMPLTIYCRIPDTVAALPAPRIPSLYSACVSGFGTHRLQQHTRLLWDSLRPREMHEVDKLTLKYPSGEPARGSRIISARWVIDTEEMTPHHVAVMVIMLAEGIAGEVNSTNAAAKLTANKMELPGKLRGQCKPLRVCTKLEGFMFETFAYVVQAGYIA